MFILLSLFYYFYFSIIGIYIIFLPKVLSDIGYDAGEIGIIFGAAPLIRFILPFLFVKGIQLNSKIFKISLLLMSISSISFYFSLTNFYFILISNIIMGTGMSLVLPYIETIALHTIGKQKYGKSRLFGSLGFIIVALILVKVLTSAYIALDFLLLFTMLTIFVSLRLLSCSKNTQEDTTQKNKNDINIFKDWQLWLSLLFVQMSFGAFYNFFTIYITDHGIEMSTTIYLWSFGVLIEILMFFFQGKILHFNLLNILRFTIFTTIIRWFLVFAFANNLEILFFSQMLHALSFALFHSAAISYLFHRYKSKALAQQFFSGISYGLGGLIGALLSGYIYKYYPQYLFLSSSIIAFVAFIFISIYQKKVEN